MGRAVSEHVVWAIGQPIALPAEEQQERKLVHGCARCTARWNGKKTAHCPTCHETFSGPSAFDQHRDAGVCNTARGMKVRGLALQQRAGYVVWGYAQADDRWNDTWNEEDEDE